MSRIYDITLSCGCMLSADGGGGLIPCAGEYVGYLSQDPEYEVTSRDIETQKKHIEAWKEFQSSPEWESHLRETEERNK